MVTLSVNPKQVWAESSSLYPPSDLVFTLALGEGADLNVPVMRAATLTCLPKITGSHPFAENACRLLEKAEGSFVDLIGEKRDCTKEYIPVTVTADGVWQGRRVKYEESFGNRCVLLRERGLVFDF
ncbi:SSI family serine proteinase inhibitor [Streptomyces albireticuli]|nr:SSI family serine proteinase inhibitor [Streptomyces albireticuli]